MALRRILSLWVLFSFLLTSISLPPVQAQSVFSDPSGLPFRLPKPGARVNLSLAFKPALIKGLRVHPDDPFLFDFIVDPGQEDLSPDDLKRTSQRMVNYFLASLTTPEKDLWVNLSPVEKDHIIPDSLNKTELGRDLLAEDYMLKQVGASLIYPESGLGKAFWNKVYGQAYQKFGVDRVPVNVFNKIWILPEKASVFERGNTVYIVNAHLKVMLEEDYLAQKLLGKNTSHEGSNAPVKDISKQVLREIIVPAIEKEVNEDKNFAQLRQVFYSLILAQWYQDVFKQSILNKIYSGRNKVAGIDVSDPKNKDLIYRQYLSAYKKGVFNYIKEETDQITQQPIPRKYFSGGFVDQPIRRSAASDNDLAMAAASSNGNFKIEVHLDAAMSVEPRSSWNDLKRPLEILDELRLLLKNDGTFDRVKLYAFIEKYSAQVAAQKLYPVQGAWPVLKAVTLLERSQEQDLIAALQKKYSKPGRPELVDKIFLMNNIYDRAKWLKERTPYLVGRRIYLAAAEIHYWAGGLGPVMKFHGKGMKDLGADVAYIEPWYQNEIKREGSKLKVVPLNYLGKNIGLTDLNEDFDEYDVQVGDLTGAGIHTVHVRVATGIDENGIRVYMFKDVQPDGSSLYTKMLYNYWNPNNPTPKEKFVNPITQEESMAFLNVASAALIRRLEAKRKQDQGDSWKPAVVHSNDGQFAPLQAVTMSKYGTDDVIKDIFWAFTTHTYRNRGGNETTWTINVFLKHMMGVLKRYITAFQQPNWFDYTSGGVRLADWAGAVSDKHRDDMSEKDQNKTLVSVTNGAVPEEMASIYREEFNKLKQEGRIAADGDFERPTAGEDALVKIAVKTRINTGNPEDRIKTANGAFVEVDLDKPMLGYVRRLVSEKVGRSRALSDSNIWELVKLGYNVVLTGNNQGSEDSEAIVKSLRILEINIADEKRKDPKAFPGSFQFVQTMTPLQKKLFLAAADIQIQDSDEHTGAAEFSEEDITANGGLQAGPTYREGVIVDQGIPLDFDHPGDGQTLIPREDTSQSWLETVYIPLIRLWNKDPQHLDFYKNAALSPRLNRVQRYLITSAAYLREYNKVMERQEEDKAVEQEIVKGLAGNREVIDGILNNGHNEVQKFGFYVMNTRFEADNGGLIAFLKKMTEIEDNYGYDVFLAGLFQVQFTRYLEGLFGKTASAALLTKWLEDLGDDPDAKPIEKQERFRRFVDGLATQLGDQLQDSPDRAMTVPGGIKLDHIDLGRQGQLMTGVVSDKGLEDMILNAQGLQGVIIGITPIQDLPDFIK